MKKDESLKFLQECIDEINFLTDEEIEKFKEIYFLNCDNKITENTTFAI